MMMMTIIGLFIILYDILYDIVVNDIIISYYFDVASTLQL